LYTVAPRHNRPKLAFKLFPYNTFTHQSSISSQSKGTLRKEQSAMIPVQIRQLKLHLKKR
jgi:hypothetical protein